MAPLFPSAGSRRARFPAIKGHTEALRLPARAFPLPLVFGHGATRSSCVRARRSAPGRRGGRRRACKKSTGLGFPVPACRARGRERDLTGSWAICPAAGRLQDPGLEPKDLASGGLHAAPGSTNRRPQRVGKYRGGQGFSIRCCHFHQRRRRHPCKTLLPAGGLRLYREGVEPSNRYERFQDGFAPPFQGLACRANLPRKLRKAVRPVSRRLGPWI